MNYYAGGIRSEQAKVSLVGVRQVHDPQLPGGAE